MQSIKDVTSFGVRGLVLFLFALIWTSRKQSHPETGSNKEIFLPGWPLHLATTMCREAATVLRVVFVQAK